MCEVLTFFKLYFEGAKEDDIPKPYQIRGQVQ
jgi:hypothetical protein